MNNGHRAHMRAFPVIPAKAGIHCFCIRHIFKEEVVCLQWVPASAGMTGEQKYFHPLLDKSKKCAILLCAEGYTEK